jgi:hypothetical protein
MFLSERNSHNWHVWLRVIWVTSWERSTCTDTGKLSSSHRLSVNVVQVKRMTNARLDLQTCCHVNTIHLYWFLIWQTPLVTSCRLACQNLHDAEPAYNSGFAERLWQRTPLPTNIMTQLSNTSTGSTMLVYILPESFLNQGCNYSNSGLFATAPTVTLQMWPVSAWTMCQSTRNFPKPENYEALGTINVITLVMRLKKYVWYNAAFPKLFSNRDHFY